MLFLEFAMSDVGNCRNCNGIGLWQESKNPTNYFCSLNCQQDYYYLVGKKLTKKKAREILHHGSVHGHPLTEQQRKYFGWIASTK